MRKRLSLIFSSAEIPFGGEFAIYAGLEEKLRLFENFHFSDDHIGLSERTDAAMLRKAFSTGSRAWDCSK